MELDLIELNRCRDEESVEETTGPLEAAGIAYKVGSTATNFDISKIGTGDDPEVIISVRREDYDEARAALEREYAKYDLPDDHYLLSSSDEDLADILANPSDWNAFDVVHARRLAEERDIDSLLVREKKAERVEKLKLGKPASMRLLICGWVLSCLPVTGLFGGIIWLGWVIAGTGIALSLCLMKEKTPDGDFYTYNSEARKVGGMMLFFAILMTVLGVFLRAANVL